MNWIKTVASKSVFRRIEHNTVMNDILAILFHRTAATMYAIYSAWAVVSLVAGLPAMIAQQGNLLQLVFSGLVLVVAAPAALGATYWPVLARLELFAGSGFLGAILFYLYVLLTGAVESGGSWSGLILVLSVAVLPAARTVIITVLLLRQAREHRESMAAAMSEEG